MIRRPRVQLAGLILMLHPLLAHAEVSVQLDRQGNVKRVHYLTGKNGRGPVIWGQVRARVPQDAMLNPLGDTYGDLAPSIAIHPITGNPWVVWPKNEGNQKRLNVSAWDGKRWTAPARVAIPDAMGYDQLDPRLVFDEAGLPYLVYAEAAPRGRVLFTTLARGVWTPPLLLSNPRTDSSQPTATIQGGDLRLSYRTPAGPVSVALDAARVIDTAISLMDSPIPPGSQSGPGGQNPSGSNDPGGRDRPGEVDPFQMIE